ASSPSTRYSPSPMCRGSSASLVLTRWSGASCRSRSGRTASAARSFSVAMRSPWSGFCGRSAGAGVTWLSRTAKGRCCFRSSPRTDDLQRLQNLSIPLRFHFVAFLNSESLIEDLGLEAILDKRALARPVAYSWLDVVLGAEQLEIAKDR